MYDVVIVGSGVAGMTAAIYAERAGLTHLLIEKEGFPGGQIVKASEVDNYPGMNKITGSELALSIQRHCKELGVKTLRGEVVQVSKDEAGYSVFLSDGAVCHTQNIIFAVGAKPRLLEIEGEREYTGHGVSYCASCDGPLFRGKTVVIIGGGDTALKNVLYMADIASHIILIHRRDRFRGSAVVVEKIKLIDKVKIITETVPERIVGEATVTGIWIKNIHTKEKSFLKCDGIFVAAGNMPETERFGKLIRLDKNGYIEAGEDCRTSEEGIYAAGDCRTNILKQVVTAAADGAAAASQIKNNKNFPL